MKERVLICEFSGSYREQGFLQWLQEQGSEAERLDFTQLEGCCCYCDEEAEKAIGAALPLRLPAFRWLDSGDYHYMSHLLALREKEPFHLVLMDHHPDNQEPAFGGVLSCGSWVRAMREANPLLRDVLSIGPDGCPEDIPEDWLQQLRSAAFVITIFPSSFRRLPMRVMPSGTVTLPDGLPGTFVWKGTSRPLHVGENTIRTAPGR